MRSPLRGSAADLLPLLAVEETYFVTTGGRLGRVLACGGLNLGLASAEAADRTAARFARRPGLPPGRGTTPAPRHQPAAPRRGLGAPAPRAVPPAGWARTG